MQDCEFEALFSKIFPFWKTIDDGYREMLCRHTVYTKYAKGENIHGGSGRCTGAIIVKSGSVKTYILSEEGREITLYRLFPGDICMLSASCVLKAVTFDVFVDANEDCECYIVGGNAFAAVTEHSLEAENFALNLAVKRFDEVMWVMQQILYMSFDRRLARFLISESEKSSTREVKLTHSDIAGYTGSAREVVSRMLRYFSDEGMVKVSRGGIVITDREKLKEIAG